MGVDDARDRVDDAEERQSTFVEGVDSLLVRRVVDSGESTASATDGLRECDRGEGLAVERFERPRRRRGPIERSSDPPTRCGQSSPSEIGSRMSGGEAWAIVEPSMNSTIECTMDCGCTTTSMSS